jgi:hypothetical protein
MYMLEEESSRYFKSLSSILECTATHTHTNTHTNRHFRIMCDFCGGGPLDGPDGGGPCDVRDCGGPFSPR